MMRLNLIPKREYTRATCSVRDTALRKWMFHIFNGSERWEIDADTVTFECSNGAVIPAIVEDNTVVVDCTAEVSETTGRYRCKLCFVKGTQKLHSQAFDLWVEGLANGNN